MFPFGETVTFESLSTSTTDAHGNPVETYDAPVDIPGCGFDPGGTVETYTPGRDAVVSSPRVFIPSGVFVYEGPDLFILDVSGDTGARYGVNARDRVTVRGILYEVKGDPADWVNPFTGWAPGGVLNLERVAG